MKKPLPWLRVYTDAYRHPKLRRLSDKLHRFWFGCLCLAGEHGGVLPEVADVASYLVMPEARAAEYLNELRVAGLFDETEYGMMPHNWNARQYVSDVSTERVRAFRKRRETVSETAPDTDTDTEQIQRQKQSRTEGAAVVPFAPPPRAAARPNWPPAFDFEAWIGERDAKHPIPGKLQIALGYALDKVYAAFTPEEFDKSHDEWCEFWKGQSSGIPSLATFIFEAWYRKRPPIREPPAKKSDFVESVRRAYGDKLAREGETSW